MNQYYPDRHHPIYFLQDALEAEGTHATFHRDEKSRGLWGLKTDNGRMVVWLIDIRWQHERDTHEANIHLLHRDAALIVAAQKPDADYFGCPWLPLAVSPGYAPPRGAVEKLVDVAMVGYVRDKQREQLLLDLNAVHSMSVAQGVFGVEAVETYHGAKLGINIPTRYDDARAYDSANMRFFEILATGTPLVTSYEDYLPDLGIVHGENAFTYHNTRNCLEVVKKALVEGGLDAVGEAGARLVQERHTYSHRAKQVIEWLT